ncbi:hypothetical protein PLICRDRAFT_56467 [Plicaturopsis crispa FD-325 SS-3]|nr:hypothetical protein PLICRDRAFT_56467 [Plicaturopsis crispa FD-325 SS-3]
MSVQISLKNGDRVKVNDHVYCSPKWEIRDGTPYSVARIMEFLGPEGAPKGNGKGKENYTRVRLAWYYRPSDVSDRPVADSRLLLAAIYSEICDLGQLRSKCHVIHRDKISDLAGWRKRPDRFYFNRAFDPYIKKEFEVIQATDVRNLPANVRETLTERYEYVLAEKEVVPDLTDTIRLCDTCQEWCANPETVQCDRCKKHFHMHCVQPPLLAKPSRGYGWTCAPCSRAHEEEVDSHEVRHLTPVAPKPKSNAPAPRGRGRPRKDRTQAEKEENMEIKHFRMWPFRYFGQYTVAEDTLDPDDLIFPRAATRVGPRYQVNVPALNEPTPPEIEERGGESTIELLSNVVKMQEQKLEKHLAALNPDNSVDYQTEVIRRFSVASAEDRPMSTVNMQKPYRFEKWKKQETPVFDAEWTRQEVAAFEDTISLHGAELRAVREEVGTRSMPEVVRFYAHWKNSKLGEENNRIRAERSRGAQKISTRTSDETVDSDDEGSIVMDPMDMGCGACRTHESKRWWKAPKNFVSEVLCDNCGQNWRKYADLNVRPVREESVPSSKGRAATEKREGSPLAGPNAKRVKTTTTSAIWPSPPLGAPHIRCLACSKPGYVGKVLRCSQCQVRVHPGSCGAVVDPATKETWMCELCENEKTLEASLNTDCVLCPRKRKDGKQKVTRAGDKTSAPVADTYLRISKPTEGQGWAHVLCSTFIPEVSFTDSERLRLVEGISTIPRQRWSSDCALCTDAGGAVIRCCDCPKEFHASCAWKFGHTFGFEITPVKNSRRDITTTTTFNGETGIMNAVVRCKDHDRTKRDIYDICETNEGGETALQIYSRLYKQAHISQAHGLLRKARRLDQVLNIRPDNSFAADVEQAAPPPTCYQCRTEFSPSFHLVPPQVNSFLPRGAPDTWLCHKCHYEQASPREDAVDSMVS